MEISLAPWDGIFSHSFRYFLAMSSNLSRCVLWISWTDRWYRIDNRAYLEYILVLCSPLRLELSMFWSFFFSFSDKNSNISWGLLRAVTIDPRNFCGLFFISSIGWLIPFSVRLKLIPVVYILQYCLNCSGWKPVIIFILSSTAPIVLDTDDCILTKTKMRGDIILH